MGRGERGEGVICSSCGAENRVGRRFCAECGTALAAACPACGAANEPGEKFCGDCGAPLPGAAAAAPSVATSPARPPSAPSAAGPIAERRLVSVLFADLVGFTPFAEGRDAEEVRDTLTRYSDLASEVVARYGGTVEKFIGDAVMAVWGVPTAHEDDAERAVRAGLELVDAVRVLGPSVTARAGVLTGEAAVTLGATNQGIVAGDLVNTASRLQSVAPAGAVLVGEATQRAASRAIAFEAAGDQLLKGKAAPVAAWRAVRVVAERGGRNRSETLEAPFVGRDDELRLIKDLFHATDREGRARLVSVMGPAGIGKSRLAWEFEKYVDGIVGTVWWHDGRSPAYGDGVSFWALGEMIRARAGLLEADDQTTTRERIATLLDGLALTDADRRWIEPALLVLLGVEVGVDPAALFGAWRTFFERLAAAGPVVLVFEDLHWADAGTLDFIDHLLEWSRSTRLYIVTLARPELLDRRPDWGVGKRSFTSLYLEPLPEPAMRQLLSGLVPGLPEPTVRSILARAEGVPLYAVETVRVLVADGRLVPSGDGTFAPMGGLESLPVPETLTALIASRLDALVAAERGLLLDAAVLGQSFTPAALAAVSGLDEAALEPRLKGLLRRELLARQVDPRSPERGQYAFVQALIREVAYNTLAKPDRKARHLAAARYFESLGSDELAGALAGHYLAARASAPDGPERDALAAQARISLLAAAERAAALGSHDQAILFLEQSMGITTDAADRATMLERAADEAATAGHHDAAERYLRDALGLRRELGDRPTIAATTAALGRVLTNDFRTTASLALLEPAAAEFADLAEDPGVIALGSQLARAFFLVDDHRRTIEVADRVLEAAEHAGLRAVVADTLVTKGGALCGLDRTIEGIALLRASRELASALGLGFTLLRAYQNLAVAVSDEDPRSAYETALAGIEAGRRLGDRHVTSMLTQQAIYEAIRNGDWAWAVDALEAALADDLESTDRLGMVSVAAWLHVCRGDPVDQLLDELARLAAAAGGVMEREVWWNRGMSAFAGGQLADARSAWHRVIEISPVLARWTYPLAARAALWMGDIAGAHEDLAAADAAGSSAAVIVADLRTLHAGVAALNGRADEALVLYRDALRAWRDIGLAWDEALCGVDMAILLDPDHPEVRAAAERSREILARLGAKPYLERLEAAMSRGGAERDGSAMAGSAASVVAARHEGGAVSAG